MLKLLQMTDVGNKNTTQETTIAFGVGLALARPGTHESQDQQRRKRSSKKQTFS